MLDWLCELFVVALPRDPRDVGLVELSMLMDGAEYLTFLVCLNQNDWIGVKVSWVLDSFKRSKQCCLLCARLTILLSDFDFQTISPESSIDGCMPYFSDPHY